MGGVVLGFFKLTLHVALKQEVEVSGSRKGLNLQNKIWGEVSQMLKTEKSYMQSEIYWAHLCR